MKIRNIISSLACTLLLTLGVTTAISNTQVVNATETKVTIDKSDFTGKGTSSSGSSMEFTRDKITVATNKGYGDTKIKFYKGATITISSTADVMISSITFNASTKDNNASNISMISGNDGKYETSGYNGTWTRVFGSSQVTFNVPNSYTQINSIDVYYDTPHSLTYNANEGTGSITGVTSALAAKVASGDSLSRSGYSFTGWNTLANGTGTAYAPDSMIQLNEKNETLYAQWKEDAAVYQNVEFNYNYSGSPENVTKKVVNGQTISDYPSNPTRTFYSFYKWFIDTDKDGIKDEGENYWDSTVSITNDLYLSAQWYDEFNDIANIDSTTAQYQIKAEVVLKAKSNQLYVHDGTDGIIVTNFSQLGAVAGDEIVARGTYSISNGQKKFNCESGYITELNEINNIPVATAVDSNNLYRPITLKNVLIGEKQSSGNWWSVYGENYKVGYQTEKVNETTYTNCVDGEENLVTGDYVDISGVVTTYKGSADSEAVLEVEVSSVSKVANQVTVTYKVSGQDDKSISALTGGTVTKPSNPTKNSSNFLGWYVDSNENGIKDSSENYWNFDTTINEALTLTADFSAYTSLQTNINNSAIEPKMNLAYSYDYEKDYIETGDYFSYTDIAFATQNNYQVWKKEIVCSLSGTKYLGITNPNSDYIRLNNTTSTAKPGIYTIASEGNAIKVSVSWNEGSENNKLIVYGSNNPFVVTDKAYAPVEGKDMYKIGEITKTDYELTIPNPTEEKNNKYIAIQANGLVKINGISIEWDNVTEYTVSNDEFRYQIGVSTDIKDYLSDDIVEYGFEVTAGGTTKYYDLKSNKCYVDPNSKSSFSSYTQKDEGGNDVMLYTMISLGSVFSEGVANPLQKVVTEFTVKIYMVDSHGVKVVSTQEKTYSLRSIIKAYHDMPDYSNVVEKIYSIFYHGGLYDEA